jgi:hypothetical protein
MHEFSVGKDREPGPWNRHPREADRRARVFARRGQSGFWHGLMRSGPARSRTGVGGALWNGPERSSRSLCVRVDRTKSGAWPMRGDSTSKTRSALGDQGAPRSRPQGVEWVALRSTHPTRLRSESDFGPVRQRLNGPGPFVAGGGAAGGAAGGGPVAGGGGAAGGAAGCGPVAGGGGGAAALTSGRDTSVPGAKE